MLPSIGALMPPYACDWLGLLVRAVHRSELLKKLHPMLSDSLITYHQEDWLQGTCLKNLQSLVTKDCIPDQRVWLCIYGLEAQRNTLRMIWNKAAQGLLTDGYQSPESKWQRSLLPGIIGAVNIWALNEGSSNNVINSSQQMRSRVNRRCSKHITHS